MAARRYTKGKLRYELIPDSFLKELSKVYTIGAEKYTIHDDTGKIIDDGADNWRKGLSWRETLGAIYRHLEKFKKGEDFDHDYPPEYIEKYGPTYHLANAAWGIASILEYYKTHPELDDRPHKYLKRPKIGLDIDNVICDWTKAWGEQHNLPTRPASWQFSYGNKARFSVPKEELEAFYKTLPRQCEPHDIPFEPCAYLTARSIDPEVTKAWLEEHGFPTAPVITVPFGASKVEAAKAAGIEWFIDDSYDNFVELNNAGICCFLFNAEHNKRYDVGYKRIMSFADFKERFL